jgi:hypothetical protein
VPTVRTIALLCTVVGYLAVALTPCPGSATGAAPAAISHVGHVAEVGSAAAPPCHAPELTLRAPCACGCGERAVAAPFAKVGAPLRSAAPPRECPGSAPHPLPPVELAREPVPDGVDPVPRAV